MTTRPAAPEAPVTAADPAASVARATAARLGPLGVWSNDLATVPADDLRCAARTIEDLGYTSLWSGEVPRFAREAFAQAAILLAATDQLTVATGIASIWLREPATMAAAAGTLAEAYRDRFILGIGASHASAVSLAGKEYPKKPLSALRSYLERMEEGSYFGPSTGAPVPVVIAALRERMQELGRDAADGIHTFFVTPDHTAEARLRLGPAPLLIAEQAVVVEHDPHVARDRARAHVQSRLDLPNYVHHLRALGYAADDLASGASDRLVDELVAWGNADRVVERIDAHLAAGADHVAVHPLATTADPLGLDQLRLISEAHT